MSREEDGEGQATMETRVCRSAKASSVNKSTTKLDTTFTMVLCLSQTYLDDDATYLVKGLVSISF